MSNTDKEPKLQTLELITTIPFSSDASLELEHEEMLLRCFRNGDQKRLIELTCEGVVLDPKDDIEIIDPRPTLRLDKPN